MSDLEIQKILIVSAHFYPLKGGTATHTENLCFELSKLGYEVHLVTEDNECPDLDEHDASRIYHVRRLKTKRFRGDLFFPLLVGLRINKIIKEFNPDIINISTGNYVPLGLKLSKKQNVPIIYTVHNVPPEEYTLNISKNPRINETVKKYYFKLIRLVAKACMRFGRYDSIISVSERTKGRLIDAGAKSDDISVVSNGVSLPKSEGIRLEEDNNWFNILVTAGVIEHKGQYELVQAMDKFLSVIPNARCYIVGPIRSQAYYEKIQRYISEKGYAQNVILTGEASEAELEDYYAKCDLYVQPSYQEGFCIAIMEAMIRGKPVIGTAVGAIPELLAEGRGIVISKPEVELLADSVIRMYQDSGFRLNSARSGREYILREYEWGRVAKETVDVYRKALLKKK